MSVNQHTKDVYVVPFIMAVVVGLLLIPVGAWLTNQPMRAIVTKEGLRSVVYANIPGWGALLLLICILVLAYFLYRLAVRIREFKKEMGERGKENFALIEQMKQKEREHEAEIEALKKPVPKLHAVWNQVQTFWHMGSSAGKPAMQIVGWIKLNSSDTDEILYLLTAYINDRRAYIFMDVKVEPEVLQDCQVVCFFEPPLETDPNVPFTATIVVEDHKNRRYELPRQTFRPTPPRTPFPIQTSTKAAPELHIAWRGISGWCWTQYQDERVVRLSGDGPIQLDNISERVMMIGVRIEGAEFVGAFDNFNLEPGQPVFRGMNLDFRGIHPKGKEPLTVKLVFIDLRGNEYPTKEATFQPVDVPERYNGIPWAKV